MQRAEHASGDQACGSSFEPSFLLTHFLFFASLNVLTPSVDQRFGQQGVAEEVEVCRQQPNETHGTRGYCGSGYRLFPARNEAPGRSGIDVESYPARLAQRRGSIVPRPGIAEAQGRPGPTGIAGSATCRMNPGLRPPHQCGNGATGFPGSQRVSPARWLDQANHVNERKRWLSTLHKSAPRTRPGVRVTPRPRQSLSRAEADLPVFHCRAGDPYQQQVRTIRVSGRASCRRARRVRCAYRRIQSPAWLAANQVPGW